MDPQDGQPVQAVPVPNVPVPNADAADAPPVAHVAPPDIPAADAQQGAADADPMPVLTPDPMLNAPPREMTLTEKFGEIKQFEQISSFLGINIKYHLDMGMLCMDVDSKISALIKAHNLESAVVDKSEIPFKEKEFENLP